MKKNVLLFALPVALIGLLFLVWRTLSAPDGDVDETGETPAVMGPAEPGSVDADPAVAAVTTVEAERDRPRGDRSVASEDSEFEAKSETFSLEDAIWIEGRVQLPNATPPEADLEVVVLSLNEDEIGAPVDRDATRYGWLHILEPIPDGNLTAERPAEPDERRWSRRPVAADGGFRAPCSAGTHTAIVLLKADYLFLQDPVRLTIAEGELSAELEPEIGGRLILTFLPPANAEAEALDELVGTRVLFGSFNGRSVTEGRRPLRQSLICELPQIPHDGTTFFGAETETFVEPMQIGVGVIAGEDVEVDIELKLGALIGGTVVDLDGRPVGGANVASDSEQEPGMFGSLGGRRSIETEADGHFELRAIRPGKSTLTVTHPEYLAEEIELDELADGDRREEITVSLDAGSRLSGRVLLPSGEPAGDALVRLIDTGGGNGDRTDLDDQRKVSSQQDGTFTIGGLGNGPFALRAMYPKEPEDGEEVFKLYVEDVALTADLTLQLEATRSVQVQVQDDVGAPVPSFKLSANQQDVELSHVVRQDFEDEQTLVRLDRLLAGRWTLSASGQGYNPTSDIEFTVPHDGPPIVVTLTRAGLLTGVVLDPHGQPVDGADVNVEMVDDWRYAETEDGGLFRVENVRPGLVKLRADSEDWAPSDELEIDVASGDVVEDLVLQLTLGGSLTGEVYAKDGSPASGRMIQIQAARGDDGASLTSDSEGLFEKAHLEPGSYQIIAMPDMAKMGAMASDTGNIGALLSELETSTATIVAGETTHVVLGAPPADPVRLFGQITQDGAPMPQAFLAIVGEDRAMLDALKFHQSDEDGRYELVLDGPGNYTFMIAKQMGDDQAVEFSVTIPATDAHELDFIVPLGAIYGRVTDPSGRGLEEHYVQWERAGAMTNLGGAFGPRGVNTDDDGSFEITWLQPGTYTLRAGPSRWGSESEWSTTVRAGITVDENEIVEGVEIQLEKPGRVTGLIVDEAGEPLDNAVVWVRDAAGQVVHPDSLTRTGTNGRFEYEGIAPGIVTVRANLDESMLASAESGPVTVLAGDDAEVELTLEAAGKLEVAVENSEGELIRCRIDVFDRDGRLVSGLSAGTLDTPDQTLSSTTRRLGPLPPGRYRVVATAPDGRSEDRPVTLRAGGEKKVRLRFKD